MKLFLVTFDLRVFPRYDDEYSKVNQIRIVYAADADEAITKLKAQFPNEIGGPIYDYYRIEAHEAIS